MNEARGQAGRIGGSGRTAAWIPLSLVGVLACASSAKPPAQTPAAAVAPAPAGPEAGPPITLIPANMARPFTLASISIGSFDRLLDNGVRLVGSAFPLPMTASGVRDWLFSEAGLSPDVAANLDLAAPIGAVVMGLENKRTSLVLAVGARGPAQAQRLVDALGKRVMTRGALTLVATGEKSQTWVYREGNVVVLGDEIDGMQRGALLAIEARHPSPEDVTATVFPDAIAKANGTDVKTALAALMDQVRETQKAEAAKTGTTPPDASAYEMIGQIVALIGDANPIEIGLSLDPARGLVLRGRLNARPGSALAAAAREVRPFEIDPAVLIGASPPAIVGAASIGTIWGQILTRNRARLAAVTDKGAAPAVAYFDTVLAGMAGMESLSVTVGTEVPLLSGVFSAPLKDAAAAAKVAAALGKLDAKAMDAMVRSQVPDASAMFEWTSKQETVGKAKALRFRLSLKKGSPYDGEMAHRLLGKSLDIYQAVAGNRVVVTFGRDARATLSTIAGKKLPAPAVTAAALADAQAAAKGRDAFYYFDFAPLLRVMGQYGDNPKLSAVARNGSGPIPLVFTAGGDGAGKVWTADLTLPPTAFTSIGALVASAVMSGGK
jgi:hypothetical protein